MLKKKIDEQTNLPPDLVNIIHSYLDHPRLLPLNKVDYEDSICMSNVKFEQFEGEKRNYTIPYFHSPGLEDRLFHFSFPVKQIVFNGDLEDQDALFLCIDLTNMTEGEKKLSYKNLCFLTRLRSRLIDHEHYYFILALENIPLSPRSKHGRYLRSKYNLDGHQFETAILSGDDFFQNHDYFGISMKLTYDLDLETPCGITLKLEQFSRGRTVFTLCKDLK